MEPAAARLLKWRILERIHISARVIYALPTQEAFNPFVECVSCLVGGEALSKTLKLDLKRSIEHIWLLACNSNTSSNRSNFTVGFPQIGQNRGPQSCLPCRRFYGRATPRVSGPLVSVLPRLRHIA
jgi:hypothetical protein